jgi:hypothetical protein
LFNEFNRCLYSFLGVVIFEFTDISDGRISDLLTKHCSAYVGEVNSEYSRRMTYLSNTIDYTLGNNSFNNKDLISFYYNKNLTFYIINDCIKNLITKVHKKFNIPNLYDTYDIIKSIFIHTNSFNTVYLNEYVQNDKLVGKRMREFLIDENNEHDLNKMIKSILSN